MIIKSGLKSAAVSRLRPMMRPSGIATRSASAKPVTMRRTESRIANSESLSVRIVGSSRSAACAGGRPLMPKE
jgi:hypothetical protein